MSEPTDDDLDARLRAGRPTTDADAGWAASAEGVAMLRRIGGRVSARRHRRRYTDAIVGGFAAAASAVLLVLAGTSGGPAPDRVDGSGPGNPPRTSGLRPPDLALVGYDTCTSALAGLRQAAATHRNAYRQRYYGYPLPAIAANGGAARADALQKEAAPEHSTTNNQEAGVDEPDVVKTDGRRILSVTDGVLRVTDVSTRKITGQLDLTMYAGAQGASLLLAGDRAVVLLGDTYRYGPMIDYDHGQPREGRGTVLLVDLAGSQPRVTSTFRPDGGTVDARMTDGVVRLVVGSRAKVQLPSDMDAAAWRSRLASTPLTSWLPTWTVTTGDRSQTRTLPCSDLRHPVSYTGADLLTVYSLDPAAGFAQVHPVSIAADGATVYGSGTDLYVTDQEADRARIHRFDVTGATPQYLGSGSVRGWVKDSYSLSEYDGTLRVVTTSGRRQSSTSVVTLDADTLRERGRVDGLGVGEQVYGVRFAGPVGYVVTFRQVDPLYVLDLRDPDRPRRAGELKITGYSSYLHVVGDGRLLGVGAGATGAGRVTGGQVSLFGVGRGDATRLLDRVDRPREGVDQLDPHAFLWWQASATAFVPLSSWRSGVARVLAVRVSANGLTERGEITNPAGSSDRSIVRTAVVGDDVWTLSASGLQASSLATLDRVAWLPFD
ncbi:beta-propeller domain-containing protein [Jatrophihabitans fulvus]